jgi:hypothetical protein
LKIHGPLPHRAKRRIRFETRLELYRALQLIETIVGFKAGKRWRPTVGALKSCWIAAGNGLRRAGLPE